MTKSLSEQLSDLSVHAKNVEDAFSAAQKEGHDKIVARTKEAHDAATAAVENAKRSIKSAGDLGAKKWEAAKAKVAADVDNLKARVASKKRSIDARIAENVAEDAEDNASWAIDYAIASVEQAKLAVFDAISARLDAKEAAGVAQASARS
jgi:hypothetical protein